jgi:serine/threonine protein kinase/Flp pilus assembly protein TadD
VPPPERHGLVERLVGEMGEAWRRGERPAAEGYLETHPELCDQPEAAVRLVYEEVCLRQEAGESVETAELARRFPRWAAELAVLLDCHRLMQGGGLAPPRFPEVGEWLGDFRLVAELGRGAHGRVFLATQTALADRPVVLKVSPRRSLEHLSLARLQHTHIIPLHAAYDFPESGLRALCLPYLGGATLAQVLYQLGDVPPARRTGKSLIEALDAAGQDAPVRLPVHGAYRQALLHATYVEAVCRVALCLTDGLHYAHERGLLHLDLKPANVLLAADAQPLLLDFHLALRPLRAGQPAPEWIGGTSGYMAPEQEAACAAGRRGSTLAADVDVRCDIHALGRLLYVLLAGDEEPAGPLYRRNPAVSRGLSDVVGKCLHPDPARRYASAAALAADLRRHLTDLPLRGVPNRSLAERWRKWRRRRPNAPLWAGLLLALVAAGALLAAGAINQIRDARQVAFARSLLREGALERAAEELDHAVERRPDDFSAHFDRGVCAYRRRDYAEAVRSFGAAAALAPASAECYFNRALAYAAWGRADRALADYDRALSLSPRFGVAALNRGVLHFQQGRLDQARTDLEQALRDGAEPDAAHYNLALVALAAHDRPTALDHLEQTLRLRPAHAEARSLRELVLRQK